ncbi:SDR family oxidoreductase [Mycobacterium interjectum]|uniref:SDR family oxidoreductase n=1 Tax=Mycobacterium interjectum TaxID=33895 RepID=UPI001430F3B1|nr:SDR family oxidoreductase [Mycobacterium interjectum]
MDEINRLNVFPVADSDTGANMLFTMRSALAEANAGAAAEGCVARVAAALSSGALNGARGNSGVILSQILRGIADVTAAAAAESGGELRHMNAAILGAGLQRGVELVIASMGGAEVPGTIVSVLRAAADAIEKCADEGLPAAITAAGDAAVVALEKTPEQLDVTEADLDKTARLVRDAGRNVVPVIADVRDLAQLQAGVRAAIDELGEIDIVIANAGVVAMGDTDTHSEPVFTTIVDTNLKGVWHTMLATVPSIIRKGRGGSVVLVSSAQGLTGRGGDGSAAMFAYAASKHGVVGLMRSAANAYAQHRIRVNSVNPSGVATPMILNDFVANRMIENPNPAVSQTLLPDVPLVEARDVTEAVLWLVGPRSRYVTGVSIPVDAGHVVM